MDKKEVGIRLRSFLQSLELSNIKIAEYLDVDPTVVSKMKKGLSSPVPHINKLSELGLNLHWFFTGDGEMFLADSFTQSKIEEAKQNVRKTIEELELFIDKLTTTKEYKL